MEYKTRL